MKNSLKEFGIGETWIATAALVIFMSTPLSAWLTFVAFLAASLMLGIFYYLRSKKLN